MNSGDPPLNNQDTSDVGLEGGLCASLRCNNRPALWYNHATATFYCGECAHEIGSDKTTYDQWMTHQWPRVGHPMFEMRTDMERRERSPTRSFGARVRPVVDKPSRFIRRYGRHRKIQR